MSEIKHTPGPWKLNGNFNVCADHGRNRGVATCGGYQDGKEATFDENCANARLIAAAPEMLEALKAAIKSYDGVNLKPTSVPWLAPARAAIAKAEDRQ